ncbi:MAG: rRNA maturation RNase YbeY [Blastocatellia bacterium]|nr:MAG: rRNA maturation RNase YbeY [Blastocatellia bacterium]
MVEVVNRQRRKQIDVEPWQATTAKMLVAIGHPNASVTVAFVSDKKIRELNKNFRGIDKATDVLSFPTLNEDEGLGDIAISVDRAKSQAKENGLTFDGEVSQLLLHGLLHLSGYDHETDNGEMNRLELQLRKKLKI